MVLFQEYSPGPGLGLFSVGKRSQPQADAFVRKYREDRPTYMTNHADAAMRSLGWAGGSFSFGADY